MTTEPRKPDPLRHYTVVGSVMVIQGDREVLRGAPPYYQQARVLRCEAHPPAFFRLLMQSKVIRLLPSPGPCPLSTNKARTHQYTWLGYASKRYLYRCACGKIKEDATRQRTPIQGQIIRAALEFSQTLRATDKLGVRR